ncbi:hypothetical protein EDB92DRAFT_600680 [Lactarius akahatsu]|uniref:Uncharacterized protein n=1 Tax=Lactarius akahatsu TaxID=416441 RepID=A0AAD4L696_9AGAM|nr:hypothetical protein EDB92DRAFT_600680 [Lactarius akahatsu]
MIRTHGNTTQTHAYRYTFGDREQTCRPNLSIQVVIHEPAPDHIFSISERYSIKCTIISLSPAFTGSPLDPHPMSSGLEPPERPRPTKRAPSRLFENAELDNETRKKSSDHRDRAAILHHGKCTRRRPRMHSSNASTISAKKRKGLEKVSEKRSRRLYSRLIRGREDGGSAREYPSMPFYPSPPSLSFPITTKKKKKNAKRDE